jgi:large subunit ribosomal protein L28
MARVCEICGKRPTAGRTYARRGLAIKKGGVGIKTTRKNKRRFLPNIRKVKVLYQGVVKRLSLCTGCLRTGVVKRPTVSQKVTSPQPSP